MHTVLRSTRLRSVFSSGLSPTSVFARTRLAQTHNKTQVNFLQKHRSTQYCTLPLEAQRCIGQNARRYSPGDKNGRDNIILLHTASSSLGSLSSQQLVASSSLPHTPALQALDTPLIPWSLAI
ncbi:hypothetical protein CSUB01_08863 [Colletotrichum sublineola]|uniref:Uncharacterized protein n=1 Tax=Colletotrichum sublineola TaxID=1173701 RepID=A0A066WZ58_COLSU|nr:hypothetical protein CSUB01_08863 [Colletotrichum sublineola]